MVEGTEKYLTTIRVGVIRAAGLGIIRTPDDGGPGHCDITGRKTKGRLNQIVKVAEWVDGYTPE